jgi:membrane-bound lytic murein transglycosylase D
MANAQRAVDNHRGLTPRETRWYIEEGVAHRATALRGGEKGMVMRAGALVVFLFALAGAAGASPQQFPRPADMEHQVRFWRSVFADYSRWQVVVHDTVDLDKVYSVLDFRDLVDEGRDLGEVERLQKAETEYEVVRLRGLFRRFQDGVSRDDLTADERRIYDLFKNDPSPTKFIDAADDKRLRTQRGIRERFAEGYRRARHWFPEMEQIFREEGLPVELTRLPLIESCFNTAAYSKVGAAGPWQFMPTTGRLFDLTVSDHVDERKDVLASTRAAARFLERNYETLGSWPLAITAWNHGPGGMARAVSDTGTSDIAAIVRDYKGKAFGFASRNFYAEFLAALDVDKHHEAWFGPLPPDSPTPSSVQRLDYPVGIEVAARLAKTDTDTIAELNPALLDPITEGRRLIPAGYALRVPVDGAPGFDDRLAELVAERRVTRVAQAPAPAVRVASTRGGRRAVASNAVTHRVQPGQTLTHIAQRYKVSVDAIRTANRLGKRAALKRGQTLRIPRNT